MHFFEFIKWNTKIFTIGISCFFTSKKAKMRLKREIKCVLCTERMQFQYLCAKRWFENFCSETLSVKDSSHPVRSTEINTDKIKVLVDENPYSTLGCRTRPGHLTEAQLARQTCNLLIRREKNHHFMNSL